ncbi:MAG: Nif3-like dinuclear metal center hexameric protein [Clostridia bacterium]|nr:Nif3-like dinuclear metal center hexameric protein [Clostridia bacterium]
MATVKDIYNYMDLIAPFNTQEEWDNSGLLVGDKTAEVSKILFALDVTSDIIEQAIDYGAELIITHHPIIFKPVSNVLSDSLIYKLIKNNISIICAHTNYDKAIDGVNDILCNTVGFDTFKKIENTCLNVAEYNLEVPTEVFVNHIKSVLCGTVRHNSINNNIKKVAVCSGSGSDYLELAKEFNCDALLTGDASHHAFLDADEMGILLVAAGHFETEMIAILPLINKIKNQFDISCVLAHQETPIITI